MDKKLQFKGLILPLNSNLFYIIIKLVALEDFS
jgi:hypothetical protein